MKALGILIILLALVIGIVPQFTDCQAQGRALTLDSGRQIPMKCHWTARAEMAVGGPLLIVGGLLTRSKRKESLRNLSILGIALGAFAILLPTSLIGVCMSDEMLCNILMKPTLIFGGTLTIATSLITLVSAYRRVEAPISINPGGA